jgi:uncharacterized RDD family membrane protein YckC
VHLDDRVTIATPEGVEVQLVLAGLASRFVAQLLDSLLQGTVIIACLLAAAATSTAVSDSGGFAAAGFVILTFVAIFVYDVLFELLNDGRTPGKAAAGIRVVDREGRAVGFFPSVVRNALRIVDFLPGTYLVGAVSILTTRDCQRLGDLAGGTLVVRERFGGRRDRDVPIAPLSVPLSAVTTWDTTAVTASELEVVQRFLDRRLELPAPIRWHLGAEIANRLAPKVPGVAPTEHPEYLLEGIVLAKQARL